MTAPRQRFAPRPKVVLGAAVKDQSGAKVGIIQEIVQDSQSDKVVFAVVGFGGFLGFGYKFHPIPWSALDYIEDQNAYVMRIPMERVQTAPADQLAELTKDGGRTYRDRSYDYYGVSRFWS